MMAIRRVNALHTNASAPLGVSTSTTELVGELASVVSTIKAQFGPSVITRASTEKVFYGRVPSGILSLDICLAGGMMLSRAAMIYGNRSAGKTTLALKYVASVQRMFPDKFVIWADFEGTLDLTWAVKLGVDIDRLIILEPETGESGVDQAEATFRSLETCMLVTDSIAMITPMKEVNQSAEDSLPGIHARLMGNYIRKMNQAMLAERHRGHFPLLLHLNQFRMSIGLTFGDPRVLPGGKALEFSTSQQVEATNKEHFANDKDSASDEKAKLVMYNEHVVKITKDKTGGRIKEGRFKLVRDESYGCPVGYIDQSKSIINHGIARGILSGAPNSFEHETFGKFRGAPDLLKFLVENQEHERTIVAQIVSSYRNAWGITQ